MSCSASAASEGRNRKERTISASLSETGQQVAMVQHFFEYLDESTPPRRKSSSAPLPHRESDGIVVNLEMRETSTSNSSPATTADEITSVHDGESDPLPLKLNPIYIPITGTINKVRRKSNLSSGDIRARRKSSVFLDTTPTLIPNNNGNFPLDSVGDESQLNNGQLGEQRQSGFGLQRGSGRQSMRLKSQKTTPPRQEQYISRLFYEEEANEAKPSGRAIDMFSLTILKKLFCKLEIEEMYQLYSRRQFRSHMASCMFLLVCYKLIVIIACTAYIIPGSVEPDRWEADMFKYLLVKILSAGTVFATALLFLAGTHIQDVYWKWSGSMSIIFLCIYGLHCLAEPWIEAGFYHSMFDPAPMVLHFTFSAYAMLPVGTLTSLVASILLGTLSIANQIGIFVYAYEFIQPGISSYEPVQMNKTALDLREREPEEGVVNQVISICLLYLAANVIGVYLKVFCTELTYRQTFYNTRQFIETELSTSIENDINSKIKENLIKKILPEYLVVEIMEQIDNNIKHLHIPPAKGAAANRSTLAQLENAKTSEDSSSFGMLDSRLLKLNIKKHEDVTILFADIVKFVQLTQVLSPATLVETLHDLYSRFDHLSARFNCQRTKLIGDCYKCVSGLIKRTGRQSAVDAVWMGLNMAREIENVAMARHVPQLKMRIGIHSGFVFAGILGLKKWQFDVWSEDVDVANALETEGRPNCVHASLATVEKLPQHIFQLEPVKIEDYPEKIGRARDLLIRKEIRSFIVSCIDPPCLNLLSTSTSDLSHRIFSTCSTQSGGGTGNLLSPPPVSPPHRIPSDVSDFNMPGTSTPPTGSNTGNFRKVKDIARRFGDVFVTNSSLHQHHQNNNENNSNVHSSSADLYEVRPKYLPTMSVGAGGTVTVATSSGASSDNPIGNFILNTRELSRQNQMTAEQKEVEINRRLSKIFFLSGEASTPNKEQDRMAEISAEMSSIAMTFGNLRLERVYKQHRDDPFQLAIVVSYLTFLIITAIIRLNGLEGANKAVTAAISSVTTLILGLAVFFFTICGFSNKLMARLRKFLKSNFARSVAYVSAMAILYCNAFMPFYLCKSLDKNELQQYIFPNTSCYICDLTDQNDKYCKKELYNRKDLRHLYPPILNFEEAMSEPRSTGEGYCTDAYLFGDITVLLVFVTAIFSRIPFLIRYLVIIIGNLVFMFFAFLLKPNAFTAYDLCAVQHMFTQDEWESKIYYTIYTFFFFLNLSIMCYQQEKNNRIDFLLRNGAREKELELRRKLAQNSALLENILPNHVIERYITNDIRTDELYINSHDQALILFAKITNYTIEADSVEVMRALNEITAAFDNLLDQPEYGGFIEKIKINQTMFMFAAGLGDGAKFEEAAFTLLEFSAAMFKKLSELNEASCYPYALRAGLHCGPVVAGVIGSSMPLYDILGNTVNVASRLESCGSDGYIHVSEELNTFLHIDCGISYSKRVKADIKGLGVRTVYIYCPKQVSEFFENIRGSVVTTVKI